MKWVQDSNRPRVVSWNDSHGGQLVKLGNKKSTL